MCVEIFVYFSGILLNLILWMNNRLLYLNYYIRLYLTLYILILRIFVK